MSSRSRWLGASGASNGRHASDREDEQDDPVADDDEEDEDFDPAEYDTMLTLERLESLEEEMSELGVRTLDEVRRRIAELHRELDQRG